MATDSRECVATFDHISRLLVEAGEDTCGYPEHVIVHEHVLLRAEDRRHDHMPSVGCHEYQPPKEVSDDGR